MESLMREKKLYGASIRGDIQSLNELIKEDKFVLNHYGSLSGLCFNETPLHIAAARGHVDFAKVLLQHKPDLVNELDSRLRAPLHFASTNAQVEMVKLLLDKDSDVCLIEDEFGRTPLHLAAMVKGRVEVVNELVRARPESLMYPLNRMKTLMILHTYVIRNGARALEQLVKIDHTFLNSQDGEGNTILHKVVALKKMETLKYLVSRTQLVVNLKNQNSFTALDIIEKMPRDSNTAKLHELLVRAGALNAETVPPLAPKTTQVAREEVDQINATPVPVSVATDTRPPSRGKDTKDTKESWFGKKRDAILVAATVIAGMAYQAGLNPPGGVWDQNNENYITLQGKNIMVRAGTSIMAANYPREYIFFWGFNTASFVAALSTVLLLIRGSPLHSGTSCWFRVLLQKAYMWFLTGVMWVTMTTMALTYTVAMVTITPHYKGFEVQWKGTVRIVACAVLMWLALVCIVFLINICRFFICIVVKLVKCIMRPCRNANEDERQRLGNANTTTCCCMSV